VTAVSDVVSYPPPFVSVAKKRLVAFPARAWAFHSAPVESINAFICAANMPKCVGEAQEDTVGLHELSCRHHRMLLKLGCCVHLP
jgi:hypothetical protein